MNHTPLMTPMNSIFNTQFNRPPIHRFPLCMQEVINEITSVVQCPQEIALCAVLAAASMAVQFRHTVKLPGGEISPCHLFILISALSGSGKTPSEKRAFRAIREFEKLLIFQWAELMKKHKAEHRTWLIIRRGLEQKLQKMISGDKADSKDIENITEELYLHQECEPKAPIKPRILYSDVTMRALFKCMSEGLPAVGLISDDAARMLRGQNANDLSPLCEAWGGKDLRVDRLDDSTEVCSPRLTIFLQAQPQLCDKFAKHNDAYAREIGFLSRTLICVPTPNQGYRVHSGIEPPLPENSKFDKTITRILEESFNPEGNITEKLIELKFDTQAAQRFVRLKQEYEFQMLPGQRYASATDHATKMPTNIARIAAIFHVIQGRETCEINTEDLEAAIEIGNWFSNQFLQVIAEPSLEDKLNANYEKFLGYIVRIAMIGKIESSVINGFDTNHPRPIPINWIRQSGPNCIRSQSAVEQVLQKFIGEGHGCIVQINDPNKKRALFVDINFIRNYLIAKSAPFFQVTYQQGI